MKSKKLIIGILAHVDAGKTTLAESLLFQSGSIRKQGRVDHKDAFLDTYELEKDRGITIFSKQAEMQLGSKNITVLDTPGHVDFSTEMERTLRVLDYAILVISGADGVQGHVETLWRLLELYKIPTFIFVNKMDQQGLESAQIMSELHKRLDERCIYMNKDDSEMTFEQIAMTSEERMNEFLETAVLEEGGLKKDIKERIFFPCYFGSALKNQGISYFMNEIERLTDLKSYPEEFGAQVFKVARDEQGKRLTYLKITGGVLRVKQLISKEVIDGDDTIKWEEKIDQIRLYSGTGFQSTQEISAGSICAVTGLSKAEIGDGLGYEKQWNLSQLEPVLTYQIELPESANPYEMYLKFKQLQEEDPALRIQWKKELNEMQVQVMGDIQIEILQSVILERFGVPVAFGSERIVYKESIEDTVVGIGHFEPLKHYAEVHLLMEPGEVGSGIQIRNQCKEEVLPKNWQNLVLTHIGECSPVGVLTGSEVTDIRITLIAGQGHQKHTEGGDFRQATYRAIRQGLMQAKTILLEPFYEFRLEIPNECTGRAINDIQKMQGTFDSPDIKERETIIVGRGPVSLLRGYTKEVMSYTKGFGRLSYTLSGYDKCQNQEEVIEAIGYDVNADLLHPVDSIFCAHGAGYTVPWNQVASAAHIENGYGKRKVERSILNPIESTKFEDRWIDEEELMEIFTRTYGTVKREKAGYLKKKKVVAPVVATGNYDYSKKVKSKARKEKYLLVDGYNIIFAWNDLKDLAETNIEGARGRLVDILSNYQGFHGMRLIVVFDAYKVKGNIGEVQRFHNIDIVYTKEAETADAYIEKTVHHIGRLYDVTVATSDIMEQLIIMGQGAQKISAQDLLEEIIETSHLVREKKDQEMPLKKLQVFGDALKEIEINIEE